MIINIFEANLEPEDIKHLTPRKGARAILKHHDQFVLIYHDEWNLYTLPGGGIETNEDPLAALKREIKEETGFSIKNCLPTVTLKEHFFDSIWEHHFFLCETTGEQAPLTLTKEERASGHRVVFKTTAEVLDLFTSHKTDHLHHEAIYQREFLGFIHSLETRDS